MKKQYLFVIVVLSLLATLVITSITISYFEEPHLTHHQEHDIDTIVLGIIPLEDQVTTPENFKNTIKYLEQSLGMKVETFITVDYGGMVDALNNNLVDIALLGGYSFVLTSTYDDSVEVFATGIRSDTGSSTYHSIIISHKDTNMKSINHLKENANNVTFAFVDPASTSGYLMPMEAMLNLEIDPQRHFSKVLFSEGHDKVLLAVNNKQVTAGATSDITYNKMVKQGIINPDDITILWTSEEIQGIPFVMRKDLPADLKEKIKDSFYSMYKQKTSDEFLGGWGDIISYNPVTNDDYEFAFRAAEKIGII